MSVNRVILIGNLGADPEIRWTQDGKCVANLRVATTERQRDRDGNWSDHTEWHRVVCFGRTAQNVERYVKKGRQLYIEGRLRTRKWQDRDGNDRWSTEVVAVDVRFLGGRRDDDGGGRRSERQTYAGTDERHDEDDHEPQRDVDPAHVDDDIPF